jgi:ribosomal protein L16 Arg81 hydroxylase
MTLAEVLDPIQVDEFLQQYVGQRHLRMKGAAGRFTSLLSWQELDETLSRLRVNDDRVRLVKNGQPVPRESYVQSSQSGRAQYLIGPSLMKHVSTGATLSISQVDELFPAIRQLAESCEELFEFYVAANLYAGWRKDRGFDVHWDSHDTLILQVIGRKEWKVWKPTRLHPLQGDGRDVAPLPTEDPVWTGRLEDGDMLYMPRGWWHVAYPLDEPSVHVTMGLKHHTGLDLLTWIFKHTIDDVHMRMDIPHWRCNEERSTWVAAIRAIASSAITEDAIDGYIRSLAERAHARPIVRLPRSALEIASPTLRNDTPLRLARGRRLYIQRHERENDVTFIVKGTEWRCQETLAPALQLLNHVRPSTLSAMRATIEERVRPLLRPLVEALIQAEVIWPDYRLWREDAQDVPTAHAIDVETARG